MVFGDNLFDGRAKFVFSLNITPEHLVRLVPDVAELGLGPWCYGED